MLVSAEQRIEQVADGIHYKGYLKIKERTFEYDFKLTIPIPELGNQPLSTTRDEVNKQIRSTFQLCLKKDGSELELTDEEYAFFFMVLLNSAVDLYYNPQTRAKNLGLKLCGAGLLALRGAATTIGITRRGKLEFASELCKMLNAPKFDCALTA